MAETMTTAFIIIFIHWIADFVCQTHWQAVNKSKNNGALANHVFVYTLIWSVPCMIAVDFFDHARILYWFLPITFFAHFITDYFTSRLNAKLWAKGDVHNFFVSVGFDQVLHYAQLFGTYYLLTKP